VKILNLITTIAQYAGKLFIAQKSSLRFKQPLKKWRYDNFLQNDDGYFLVEQTVDQNLKNKNFLINSFLIDNFYNLQEKIQKLHGKNKILAILISTFP